MPRRSPRLVSAAKRKGTAEEGDGGTGAQIKKLAGRHRSRLESAAKEKSMGEDVDGGICSKENLSAWVTESELLWCETHIRDGFNHQAVAQVSRPNHYWPDPEPNLNLTFPEIGLWYEGDIVAFRTLEELVEKRKARRVPTYDELVNKILAARRRSYEELLSTVRFVPNPDNLDDTELPSGTAGDVVVEAATDVVEAGGILDSEATPSGAAADAFLDLRGSTIVVAGTDLMPDFYLAFGDTVMELDENVGVDVGDALSHVRLLAIGSVGAAADVMTDVTVTVDAADVGASAGVVAADALLVLGGGSAEDALGATNLTGDVLDDSPLDGGATSYGNDVAAIDNAVIRDAIPLLDFISVPNVPHVHASSVVDVVLYKVPLPPQFCPIMTDYMHSSGLVELFDRCITTRPRSFLSDTLLGTTRWHVRELPFSGNDCDMYWISPSDFKVHQELLTFLGSSGGDVILRAISSIDSAPSSKEWTVFQLCFVLVSRNCHTRFHVDFDKSLSGDAWHVMIPVVLVPDSPPELLVQSTKDAGILYSVKYEPGVACMWGPLLCHSTAMFSYTSGYRICLSVSVACINAGNVKRIVSDISQQYPPRRMSLLMDWAKKPHFSGGKCKLPFFSQEALLGQEWLKQYNNYVATTTNSRDGRYSSVSKSLQKWICHQRYCFSLKYGSSGTENASSSSHVRSARRTLTYYREFMLRQLQFSFHVDRDQGANQLKWNTMYEELKEYIQCNGHSSVSRGENSKLYAWLRTQQAVLSGKECLSVTKRHRLYLLKELGIQL